MNKPTPISDAAMFHSEPHGYEVVPFDVAQELERKCIEPTGTNIVGTLSPTISEVIISKSFNTNEQRLLRAYKLGQELSAICREIKGSLPEQFEDAIDQNIDSLHDILNNFAGIRIHVFMEGRKCETNAS